MTKKNVCSNNPVTFIRSVRVVLGDLSLVTGVSRAVLEIGAELVTLVPNVSSEYLAGWGAPIVVRTRTLNDDGRNFSSCQTRECHFLG